MSDPKDLAHYCRHHGGPRGAEAADLIELLAERGTDLVIAYHVAICSPKGVVPMEEFYDPEIASRIEREMEAARERALGAGRR